MDFQTSKFLEFALLNNHYQISKDEGNQNFKLSASAWFLRKLALKCLQNKQKAGLTKEPLIDTEL